jgi:hypothetical protein
MSLRLWSQSLPATDPNLVVISLDLMHSIMSMPPIHSAASPTPSSCTPVTVGTDPLVNVSAPQLLV